jgi:hypothetical protein
MRLANLTLCPRCLALVLALALASSALVVLVPATASAACGYDLQVRTYYYSDPELTNYVGQCFKACWAGTTCSGEQTDYSQIVSVQVCPPRCQ